MTERVILPIHGADHCPGGPDPIPCLTDEIKYIVCKDIATGQTFATGGSDILWQVNVNAYPECFTPLNTEFSPDYNQIRILEDGLYTVTCNLNVNTTAEHYVTIYSVDAGSGGVLHHREFLMKPVHAGADAWEYTFRMDGTGGSNRVIEFQLNNPGSSFTSHASAGFYCELRKWPGSITMTGRDNTADPG